MELKVFKKSSRRVHLRKRVMLWSFWMLLTAFTTASDPTEILTPTWGGARMSAVLRWTNLVRHFEIIRRSTSPTAIGQMLPSFIWDACKVASQKWGMRSCGAWPDWSKLTTLEIKFKAEDALEGVGERTAFFKWLALRPVGHRADHKGRDLRQLRMTVLLIWAGVGGGPSGSLGGEACGRFVRSSSLTLMVALAR